MNTQAFTLREGIEGASMAASMMNGVYDSVFDGTLRNHRDHDESYTHPEFLVLGFYDMIRERNMQGLIELYDESSKLLIDEKLDINAAGEAYAGFSGFELLSKSVFGSYVRIRFNMILENGNLFPWVLMIRQNGSRYYLTETIPLNHLFISVASTHPYNHLKDPYPSPSLADMQAFSFVQEEEDIELVDPQRAPREAITVHLKLNAFDPQDIGDTPTEEITVLRQMKETLVNGDSLAFLNLWDAEERDLFASNEIYQTQIEIQRDFYMQVDSIAPLGYLRAHDEIVLFYKSQVDETTLPLQLLVMKRVDGAYKLNSALEHYYAWEILNNRDVMAAIDAYYAN